MIDDDREWPEHPVAAWQADVAAGATRQSYRDWARTRDAGLTDAEADALVTCRECDHRLDGDDASRCPASDDGQHEPDMTLREPPPDAPARTIRLDLTVTVPNDGYCYRSDVGGRIERLAGRLLEDRLVSAVRTGGPSGSGYQPDDE